MRTGGGDVVFFRIHFPTVLLVKWNCRNAPITPEEANVRVRGDQNFRAAEQFSAEAFALIRFIRGHAAELPGGFVFVRIQHETRARGRQCIFCRRIIKRDVPGGRRVIARELREFARQAGAKDSVAQVDEVFEGDAADREISCVVLRKNCFHKGDCTNDSWLNEIFQSNHLLNFKIWRQAGCLSYD